MWVSAHEGSRFRAVLDLARTTCPRQCLAAPVATLQALADEGPRRCVPAMAASRHACWRRCWRRTCRLDGWLHWTSGGLACADTAGDPIGAVLRLVGTVQAGASSPNRSRTSRASHCRRRRVLDRRGRHRSLRRIARRRAKVGSEADGRLPAPWSRRMPFASGQHRTPRGASWNPVDRRGVGTGSATARSPHLADWQQHDLHEALQHGFEGLGADRVL